MCMHLFPEDWAGRSFFAYARSCGSLCRNTTGSEALLRTFPLEACTSALCSHSLSVPDTLSMADVQAGNIEIPPEKWDLSS